MIRQSRPKHDPNEVVVTFEYDDDGYVGKARPQYLTFDREDWEVWSQEERDRAVYDAVISSLTIDWKVLDD